MFIKPKSIVVAMVSSIIVSAVLVSTLIGYYMSIELKARDDAKAALESLQKIESQIFSKHIDVSQLTCSIEKTGSLKAKAVLRGLIKNRGSRDIGDLVIKVKFLDTKGAGLYEVIFHPLEPTYGMSPIGHITQSYLMGYKKNPLKANSSCAFNRIIPNCPKEILGALSSGKEQKRQASKKTRAWAGTYTWEVMQVSL